MRNPQKREDREQTAIGPPQKDCRILCADIGGTNSRFGHFTLHKAGELKLNSHVWLQTSDADSLAGLMRNLSKSGFPLAPRDADFVSMAVAGPVVQQVRAKAPLIPWPIDLSDAEHEYGFRRFALINDFIAQALSCLSPIGRSAQAVIAGFPEPESTIAVIGAGTGLGKSVLVPDGRGGYSAAPSEGAHAGFPFKDEEEWAFQRFLRASLKIDYVTYNHVVSGSGLSALHEFLTGRRLAPAEVVEDFSRHPETLDWAARFYGRACRNFALETLSCGGMYITGGLAARNPSLVTHETFRREFLDSPTSGHILRRMPLWLMRDQNSGLWGAALKAQQVLEKEGE